MNSENIFVITILKFHSKLIKNDEMQENKIKSTHDVLYYLK